jgi:hypothetical protein
MHDTVQKSKARLRARTEESEAALIQACAELNMPLDQVLAWKFYPDRIVILFKSGQRLSRVLQP